MMQQNPFLPTKLLTFLEHHAKKCQDDHQQNLVAQDQSINQQEERFEINYKSLI